MTRRTIAFPQNVASNRAAENDRAACRRLPDGFGSTLTRVHPTTLHLRGSTRSEMTRRMLYGTDQERAENVLAVLRSLAPFGVMPADMRIADLACMSEDDVAAALTWLRTKGVLTIVSRHNYRRTVTIVATKEVLKTRMPAGVPG